MLGSKRKIPEWWNLASTQKQHITCIEIRVLTYVGIAKCFSDTVKPTRNALITFTSQYWLLFKPRCFLTMIGENRQIVTN